MIAGSDPEAFERFYDLTSSFVFGLVLRIARDRAVAEEIAQEVYVTAWRRADSFDPTRGSAVAWLGLIARSRAVDRIRSERSRLLRLREAGEALGDQAVRAADGSPEESASLAERRALVHRALEEIPEEQARLIRLAFFAGLSHPEIAHLTDTPLGTVKSRIRAGINKLGGALGPALRIHESR